MIKNLLVKRIMSSIKIFDALVYHFPYTSEKQIQLIFQLYENILGANYSSL